jgi:hypothetical protein
MCQSTDRWDEEKAPGRPRRSTSASPPRIASASSNAPRRSRGRRVSRSRTRTSSGRSSERFRWRRRLGRGRRRGRDASSMSPVLRQKAHQSDAPMTFKLTVKLRGFELTRDQADLLDSGPRITAALAGQRFFVRDGEYEPINGADCRYCGQLLGLRCYPGRYPKCSVCGTVDLACGRTPTAQCVTPTGRLDGHNKYILARPGGDVVCMFCRKP